VTKHQAHRTPI